MPGVSSRLPAKGIHGFGKVHFKFKPKPPPKGHKVLGSIIYAVFFTALLLSFGWSRPYLKYNYVLPGLRKLLSYAENLKTRISTVPEVRANSLQLNYITEVHSKTVHGALFDQGYLHATDRLVQMDILRRTALGTLSEYYGNVTVELDKFYRSLNIRDIAQHDLRALDKTGVVNLESYSAGVNMYLSAAAKGSYGGSLPIEYDFQLGLGSYSIEPWEPVHTLAVLRLLAYQWSHGWETQLVEILATKSAHVSASSLWFSRRPSASDSGSSIPTLGGVSIAVSAEKSASKAALLASSFTASVSKQTIC